MAQEKGRKKAGIRGEDLAAEYLRTCGYTILERNWRSGHLEIDIVGSAPDGLHFVEVKTLVAPFFISPEEKVGTAKQKKITEAAIRYVKEHGGVGAQELFFDVISVTFDGGTAQVKFFPKAWVPIYV